MKYFLLLACIMAVSGLHAEENKKLTIKKTPFPITINGYENDNAWQLITATPINKYDRNESTGMSGSFKMTYDDKNFYVICSIIDSTPLNFNPQNVRKSDMICLLFSMDTASNYGKTSDGAYGAIYKPGFWNFYKLMAPDSIKYFYEYDISKPLGYGGSLSGNSNYDMTTFFENVNFKYAQQVNGNHYVQEWQFPRDSLDPLKSFNGSCFKFDIEVYNSKDTGYFVLTPVSWSTRVVNMDVNFYYGFIYLSDEILSVPNSVSNMAITYQSANHIAILPESILLTRPTDVAIFGIDGKLVLKNAHTTFVNTSFLKGGIYIVKAGSETRKFLK